MSSPNTKTSVNMRVVTSDTSTGSVRKNIPVEVKTDSKSGVEAGALVLANAFLKSVGQLARKCFKRGELSHLYVSTFESWKPSEDPADERPFKQVLFALAHGMKVVRVVDRGRQLLWNRYRDNEGNPIERDDVQRHKHHSPHRHQHLL